jgi:homeobox protein Unc-4
VRKERERREKKLIKSLERQQRKLAAKGIAVDIATLRREWEQQQGKKVAGRAQQSSSQQTSVSNNNNDSSSCCSNTSSSAARDVEIDVVGDDSDSEVDDTSSRKSDSVPLSFVTVSPSSTAKDDEFGDRLRMMSRADLSFEHYRQQQHSTTPTIDLSVVNKCSNNDNNKQRRLNPFSIESLLSRTENSAATMTENSINHCLTARDTPRDLTTNL